MKTAKHKGIKAVVMGGGTGTFTVLSSLKNYLSDISAVIAMSDNGGSTGALRDELGVLPPGDVRQCLVALSSSSETMRELFTYRFPEGTFKGHSFGNLFLSALEKITGNFSKAVEAAGEVLHISGKVIPVTTDNTHLHAVWKNGDLTKGQIGIRTAQVAGSGNPMLSLSPAATLNPAAKRAIEEADLVILGPGNLHSSLIPILLVKGMKEALAKTAAKKIYVCNLMTQKGETENYSVADFVSEIERYAGAGAFDYVVYNTGMPPKNLIAKYAAEGERPVAARAEEFVGMDYSALGEDLIAAKLAKPNKADLLPLKRTLVRHDGDKLARLFMKIYFS